jgi:hypothetical protein
VGGQPEVAVAEVGDDPAGRLLGQHPVPVGLTTALVLREVDDDHTSIGGGELLKHGVALGGQTVAHHEQLKIGHRLGQDAGHGVAQQRATVARGGEDDGRGAGRHGSSPARPRRVAIAPTTSKPS